jgi:uncharacterized repeat protein (TIGR03803 family)
VFSDGGLTTGHRQRFPLAGSELEIRLDVGLSDLALARAAKAPQHDIGLVEDGSIALDLEIMTNRRIHPTFLREVVTRGFAALCAALAVAAAGSASAAPTETVLHSFTGSDGAVPVTGLIADRAGNLYGTTVGGGTSSDGVVFKLSPGGTETVLHSFTGSDGAVPEAGLIADRAGNLYGTTVGGGTSSDGVVFKLSPGGTETVLHSFTGSDGLFPEAGLIADRAGNLYGTTENGGASSIGVVFKLSGTGFVP